MSPAAPPADNDLAKRVLTNVQYLTWFLAQQGMSHRAIAYYRRVSKGTVTSCLEEADRKMEEALRGETPAQEPR